MPPFNEPRIQVHYLTLPKLLPFDRPERFPFCLYIILSLQLPKLPFSLLSEKEEGRGRERILSHYAAIKVSGFHTLRNLPTKPVVTALHHCHCLSDPLNLGKSVDTTRTEPASYNQLVPRFQDVDTSARSFCHIRTPIKKGEG